MPTLAAGVNGEASLANCLATCGRESTLIRRMLNWRAQEPYIDRSLLCLRKDLVVVVPPLDDVNPSDSAVLRKYLCTILTHLVDLHVMGKQADALFIGGGIRGAALHFHGVVELALEATGLVSDRVRALDAPTELNRHAPVNGCGGPSPAEPTAALLCRIDHVRETQAAKLPKPTR